MLLRDRYGILLRYSSSGGKNGGMRALGWSAGGDFALSKGAIGPVTHMASHTNDT